MGLLWQKLRKHEDYGYLWPLGITLLVTLTFAVLYWVSMQCHLNVQCRQPYFKELLESMQQLHLLSEAPKFTAVPGSQLRYAVTYQGHIFWSLVMALYLLTCLVALFVAVRVTCTSLPGKCGERLAAGAGSLVFCTLVLLGINYILTGGIFKGNDAELWRQLVRATVQQDVFNMEGITKLLDMIGSGAALFLAVASSAVLVQKTLNEQQLRAQQRQLLLILYVGTTMLIVSTVRLSALLHWALSYLKLPPGLAETTKDATLVGTVKAAAFAYTNLEGLITNVVTGLGAFYTLLLVAVYVPAALVLNRRAAKLDEQEGKTAADRNIPLRDQLLKLAAILGPLLAAPISELLSRLR